MPGLKIHVLLVVLALLACNGQRELPAPPISSSTVYAPVGEGMLADAQGGHVSLRKFAGRYLWVDFAAEWCAACVPQTLAVKSAATAAPAGITFATIMTSERGGYGHPATRITARDWAQRYGLAPDRVLATDLSAMTLPRNILYGPDGRVVFDRTGEMRADEVLAVIGKNVGQ